MFFYWYQECGKWALEMLRPLLYHMQLYYFLIGYQANLSGRNTRPYVGSNKLGDFRKGRVEEELSCKRLQRYQFLV